MIKERVLLSEYRGEHSEGKAGEFFKECHIVLTKDKEENPLPAFSQNLINVSADLLSLKGTHSHLADALEHKRDQKVHTQLSGGSHAEA